MEEIPPAQPLPVAVATKGHWNKIAFAVGALLYFVVMYRFQTYSQRNHLPGATFALFSAIMLVAGALIGILATGSAMRATTLLIFGVLTAHAVVILIDLREDPTNHNLFPFEFVYFFGLASPAYLGALLSRRLTGRPNSAAG